jgi:hypothetical protein
MGILWEEADVRCTEERPVKIGAKIVTHGRYAIFQMAEVAVSRAVRSHARPDRAPAADRHCSVMTSRANDSPIWAAGGVPGTRHPWKHAGRASKSLGAAREQPSATATSRNRQAEAACRNRQHQDVGA